RFAPDDDPLTILPEPEALSRGSARRCRENVTAASLAERLLYFGIVCVSDGALVVPGVDRAGNVAKIRSSARAPIDGWRGGKFVLSRCTDVIRANDCIAIRVAVSLAGCHFGVKKSRRLDAHCSFFRGGHLLERFGEARIGATIAFNGSSQ